jgi:hypothetical protein
MNLPLVNKLIALKLPSSSAEIQGEPSGILYAPQWESLSRVKKRVDGWTEKFLSQGGKEVLLKTVIQAIPTYCMSVFLLPTSLSKQLNKLMSNF